VKEYAMDKILFFAVRFMGEVRQNFFASPCSITMIRVQKKKFGAMG
jgi:hypothetical protein